MSNSPLQRPRSYVLPGRKFFDGVVDRINGGVTIDPAFAETLSMAGHTLLSPKKKSRMAPLPFDVRLHDGNVEVYLPDDESARAGKYVMRNGAETYTDTAGTADAPWVSYGAWAAEDGYRYVIVSVVSAGGFEGGLWPDNHGQPAEYVVSVVDNVPEAYEATTVVVAVLMPGKGVIQLRRGAINTEYALLDGEVEQHGEEPPNWFRSLTREGTGDRTAGWYDFRDPTFQPVLDGSNDAFPFRSKPASGTEPTVVKYIKWEDMLELIEDHIGASKPDWWEYGPDGTEWPCVQDTVFVWDPCEGKWDRKKFWVSGDQDGSTTYGNQIYDAMGTSNGRGTLAIAIDTRNLIDSEGANVLDWNLHVMYDADENPSVLWTDRALVDSSGVFAVYWDVRQLVAPDNSTAVDWENRLCSDSGNETSIDWENRTCNDTDGKPSVDWDSHLLTYWDSVGEQQLTRIDWDDCVMRDKAGLLSMKWASRELYDDYQQKAVTFRKDVYELHGNWKAASMAAVHKTAAGGNPVANGTYTVGIGPNANGTITVTDGIITAVSEAS